MKRIQSVMSALLRAGVLFCGLMGLAYAPQAMAASCTSVATGNWNAQTTWGSAGTGCSGATGGIPGAADTVTIAATHTVTLSGAAAASSVTINAATAANGIVLAGNTLTVSGAVTMTAGATNNITSTFNVDTGTLSAGSITINGGGATNRISLMTVSSGIITTTGSISFGGTAANARLTSTGASTINVGGNFGSSGTLTTSGTGTINFNGGAAQTLGTYTTYNNVTINNTSGGVTLTGATTIGGNLDVNAGTFDVNGNVFQVNGTTTVSGTLNHTSTTGTKTFVGLVTINSSGTWNNSANEAVTFNGGLTVNSASFTAGTGPQTFSVNTQALNGTVAVAIPSMTVTGVTLTSNVDLTVSTALQGTGTLVNPANKTLNIGALVNITGLTATASPNTVNYTGAAQTIKATTYHHLNLSGSGIKTLTGLTTINGNLATSGTLTATTASNLTISGNLTVGTGTTFTSANVTNTVTGTTSVTGTLAHSGAAAKTYVGAVTINSGGVWTNAGNAPVTFRGGLTHNGTTFTSGSGVYTFDTNTQSIDGSAAVTISNLTVTGVTLTNNVTLTVSTALAGTGTLTNPANKTLNIGGTSAITTLTATANPNTVNYTGAAQTIQATTYHHLGLSGSGAKTLTSATVNGTLTTGGSATTTLTSVTVNGDLTTGGTSTTTTGSNLTISGNLTVGTGSTFTSANFTNTVNGTTSVTGTLAHSGVAAKTYVGAVTINSGGRWTNAGNAPITFRGGLTYDGVAFTSGTGVYTFDTNAQSIGGATAITITNLTVTGVVLTNNGTLTVSTALSGTGTLTNSANKTLSIGGTAGITTLTASANPNTVNYTGAAQTVKAISYHHLGLSGSGAKTLTGVTVNGDLTTGGSASATTVANFTIGGNLTVGTGSTFTSANFTNTVNGTTSVTGTLAHSGAAAKTYVGAVTINSGGTWTNAGNAPISFRGGLTHNGTTFTSGTGIYTFDTNAQSIGGTKTITITNLTVTGVVLTNTGTLTASTALAGTGTLTNSSTGTLNIGGTSVITTLTATASGNTVNYTGAAQTVKATTYHHLGMSGSGVKTLTSLTTVNGNLTTSGTVTATTAANFTIGGNLTVGTGTTFTSANFTHTVTGTTSVTGTLAHSGVAAKTYVGAVTINTGGVWTNAGNAPVTFKGNFTRTGTFTSGSGTYTFNGTSTQTITGVPTFQSLTINNSQGVILATGSVTVSTLLTLTSGVITTGSFAVIVTANCSMTNPARTSGWIVGNLTLTVPSTNPVSCYFPVGTTTYAPITITKTGSNSGTLSATTTGGELPDSPVGVSGINIAKDVNRTWTLTAGTLAAGTPYSATFDFVASDYDAGATTSAFVVSQQIGSTWSQPTVGTVTATSTQATGLTAFGVFGVGERYNTAGSFDAYEPGSAIAAARTGTARIKTRASSNTQMCVYNGSTATAECALTVAAFDSADKTVRNITTSFNGAVKVELMNASCTGTALATVGSVTLTSGVGTVTLPAMPNVAYASMGVKISYPATGTATVTSCASDSFALRPAQFAAVAVTNANWTTAGNANTLNASTVSATPVHKAGRPFSIQATAQDGSGNTITGYTGTPSATVSTCATTSSACTSSVGSLNVGTGTTANGAWSTSTATYDSVGAFTLILEDSNFAAVDAADSSTAERFISSAATTVGRFVPDHYTLSNITLTPRSVLGCAPASDFTYMGESFAVGYSLKAENFAGGTITQYDGSRFPLATSSSFNFVAKNGATPITSRLTAVSSTGTWASGVTTNASSTLQISRPTTPEGSFDVSIGIAPKDADGVTLDSTVLNMDGDGDGVNESRAAGQTKLIYGRLRLSNAAGSELAPLMMPAQMEYYDAISGKWLLNTSDSCTPFSTLNGPAVALPLSGGGAVNVRCGVPNTACTTSSGSACNDATGKVSSGAVALCLPAPGVAGSADVSFTPPNYLQFGTADSPLYKGRAVFGVKTPFGKAGRVMFRSEER